MPNQKKHDEMVQGLRDLADFLESRPDVGVPSFSDFNMFTHSQEDFARRMRLMGSGEKRQAYSYLMLEKKFGPLTLALNILQSDVCERVQVGERKVEARPAIEAHTVPVYEWDCPESFLGVPGS